jgi:ZIP family zinc transporter/zinc and cadmium transporter
MLGGATFAGVLLMTLTRHAVDVGLPISAGVTIYVAASDIMPEVNHEPGVRMALLVFVGAALMFFFDHVFHLH